MLFRSSAGDRVNFPHPAGACEYREHHGSRRSGQPVAVKSGAEGWLPGRSRSLATVFRFQFGLAFIGVDCLARFGGLVHLWLRSQVGRGVF